MPGSNIITYNRSVPGATFEMIRGIPAKVHWFNNDSTPHFLPVDPTIHYANPNNIPEPEPPYNEFPPGYELAQFPVPHVTHVHGLAVSPKYDGTPDEWFTFLGHTGPTYVTRDYLYPNVQEPTTLWYHDHALGYTRLNVYSGLIGFYLIRDKKPLYVDEDSKCPQPLLPSGKYEIPMVIRDKSFYTDGSLFYPTEGFAPDIHPYWVPAFEGNTNTVNGKVWPELKVERRQYRFRILNGANFRFYGFSLSNGMPFTLIGTDGGFLEKPVELTSTLLAPTERLDILVDFSKVPAGTKIILENSAPFPLPIGPAPDPETVGQVKRFAVQDTPAVPAPELPETLNEIPDLIPNAPERTLTMHTVVTADEVVELLDGLRWGFATTELPTVGSTEVWQFVNLTPFSHAKHVHLIQYQIVNRQQFDVEAYQARWTELNGSVLPLNRPPIKVPVGPYLIGGPIAPDPSETGWKDTIDTPPNMVTRIKIRWARQNIPAGEVEPGENTWADYFDPTIDPGYIWHCHLLEHEANEMMRTLGVINNLNYPDWFVDINYQEGDRVRFGPLFYEAVQTHTSSVATRPDLAPGFWEVLYGNE